VQRWRSAGKRGTDDGGRNARGIGGCSLRVVGKSVGIISSALSPTPSPSVSRVSDGSSGKISAFSPTPSPSLSYVSDGSFGRKSSLSPAPSPSLSLILVGAAVVGASLGFGEGSAVGEALGSELESTDGVAVGAAGFIVGEGVGLTVGDVVLLYVGLFDSMALGASVSALLPPNALRASSLVSPRYSR